MSPRRAPRARVLRTDGAARGNPGPAGAGALIEDAGGRVLRELSRFVGIRTNNQAEYEALLLGLRALLDEGADARRLRVTACLDSELVVRQLEGRYRVRDPELRALYEQTAGLIARLGSFRIRHVPREQNRRADVLANLAIDRAQADPASGVGGGPEQLGIFEPGAGERVSGAPEQEGSVGGASPGGVCEPAGGVSEEVSGGRTAAPRPRPGRGKSGLHRAGRSP